MTIGRNTRNIVLILLKNTAKVISNATDNAINPSVDKRKPNNTPKKELIMALILFLQMSKYYLKSLKNHCSTFISLSALTFISAKMKSNMITINKHKMNMS